MKAKPSKDKQPDLERDQVQCDLFADLCWEVLSDFFGKPKLSKRPAVWLFLSPQSAGSLKGRTEEEKAFIHFQQERDGGATLKSPPTAWVSNWQQVAEEVAHLYAIVQKPERPKEDRDAYEELFFMTLHETFGRLGHCLILGIPQKRTKRSTKKLTQPEQLWDFAHQEGYYLGEKMAEAFFKESFDLKDFRKFFGWAWEAEKAEQTLSKLYKLLQIKERQFR